MNSNERKTATGSILRIDLLPAKARGLVVVHHADGLHEGVDDSRADELEAAALQVGRKGVGHPVGRETVTRGPARLAAHEAPQVARKAAEFLPHLEEAP